MSLPVVVSPEAERQIDAIDAWWRTNGLAAPLLFIEELAEAVAMMSSRRRSGAGILIQR